MGITSFKKAKMGQGLPEKPHLKISHSHCQISGVGSQRVGIIAKVKPEQGPNLIPVRVRVLLGDFPAKFGSPPEGFFGQLGGGELPMQTFKVDGGCLPIFPSGGGNRRCPQSLSGRCRLVGENRLRQPQTDDAQQKKHRKQRR